ncbi:MAG: hypothetical protein U0931_22105 [Vulcanimicrobiota bacterium]
MQMISMFSNPQIRSNTFFPRYETNRISSPTVPVPQARPQFEAARLSQDAEILAAHGAMSKLWESMLKPVGSSVPTKVLGGSPKGEAAYAVPEGFQGGGGGHVSGGTLISPVGGGNQTGPNAPAQTDGNAGAGNGPSQNPGHHMHHGHHHHHYTLNANASARPVHLPFVPNGSGPWA